MHHHFAAAGAGRPRQSAGSIELYRPSAAGMDRAVRLEPDANGVQRLDAAGLAPGLWQVRVSWTAEKRELLPRTEGGRGLQGFLAPGIMAIASMDLWTAFLLGLVGSLHCAGMCGPLALALPAAGNTTPGLRAGPRRLQRGTDRHLLPAGDCVWPGGLDASCWPGFSAGSPSRWAWRCCSVSSPRGSWPCRAR